MQCQNLGIKLAMNMCATFTKIDISVTLSQYCAEGFKVLENGFGNESNDVKCIS